MVDLNECTLRKEGTTFDPYQAYGNSNPTRFTMEIHHGGFFTMGSGRRYMNGKVNWFDAVDIDEFSVIELKDMFRKLGYKEEDTMYFHFRMPNKDLDTGLHPLTSDSDVLHLAKFLGKNKVIEVYMELWLSSIDIFQQSTNKPKVTFDVPQQSKNIEHDEDVVMNSQPWDNEFDMSNDFDPFFQKQNSSSGDVRGQCSGMNVDVTESSRKNNQQVEVSDLMEDDENPLNDVEVDMDYFRETLEQNVEEVGGSEQEIENNDIEVDLEEFESQSDSEGDIECERNTALRKLTKKQRSIHGMASEGNFYAGKKIPSKEVIKEMVSKLAVEERRQLHLDRNDKKRVRVICKGKTPTFTDNPESHEASGPSDMPSGSGGIDMASKKANGPDDGPTDGPVIYNSQSCPWLLHVSKGPQDETWVVKTFKDTHKCLQTRDVKKCTASYLSKDVEQSIVPNPKIPTAALRDQLQKKYHLGVSKMKTYRAKQLAREKVIGDYAGQYSQLRDYALALQEANPDTTVKLELERDIDPNSQTRQFKRIYVCLGALKKGFKAGKRELLGLDGCFLSGPWLGQILTAVGVDPNNGTYPVAYAIVESETKNSWCWFLECLGDDLDLNMRSNFTFISDRQKGIIPALACIFPSAEHRYCLKHIYDNMQLLWRGQLYKEMLWKCAAATTIQTFEKHMEELKGICKDAYLWLKKIDPCHWSRSHFSGRAHCDVLLNNMCEVLNRQLVDGRDKPIITCLEFIREYLMKKIVNVRKVIDKSDGPLTPNASRLFKVIKEEASKYRVTWNGGDKYQVNGPWSEQCVVNMNSKSCSCRKWELTGMPCKHAVAAINDMGNNGMPVGIPESYVHACYWLRTWQTMYSFMIDPVNGPEFWRKSVVTLILTPPDYHTPIGRPRKKRKKSASELSEKMVKSGKLSRAGKTVTCKICKQLGHNQRTCKQKSAAETATTNTTASGNKSATPASANKSATPKRKKSKAAGNKGAQRKNKGTQQTPSTPSQTPSQGIIIRDSPSGNTRGSVAARLSQEYARDKGKGKIVE